MRDRGRVEDARGALIHVTVNLRGLDRAGRAEEGLQLRAVRHILGAVDAPHQLGEFLILREHQRDVARPARRAVSRERLSRRRAFEHHRLVVVGHRGGGGENGPAAHRVAFEADVGLVDEVEAAQIGEAIRAAEAVRESGRVGIAVAGLVERDHDVTAAGELDGEAVLGLARIDVAVDGEDAGCGLLWRRVRRDVEQGAHGVALGALETDILDLDAAVGLRHRGDRAADDDQKDADCGQPPAAAHENLPGRRLSLQLSRQRRFSLFV